jgi:hypothetical protein
MKNSILFVLFLLFVSSTQAQDCALNFGPRHTWVRLGNGDTFGAPFQCQHCASWLTTASVSSAAQVPCPNCGHPFDGNEKPVEVWDSRNGQTYVPQQLIITDAKQIFLLQQGPDWVCGACESRNTSGIENCVGCATPKTEQNKKFDPYATDTKWYVNEKGELVPRAKPIYSGAAQYVKDVGTRVANAPLAGGPSLNQLHSQLRSRYESGAFAAKPGSRETPQVGAWKRRILLPLAIAGTLLGASTWGWMHHVDNPGDIIGTVVQVKHELVVFPNQVTMDQFTGRSMDLRYPPSGVQVYDLSETKTKPSKEPAVVSGSKVATRVSHAVIKVSGGEITISLDQDDANSWKTGQKIKVDFEGPVETRFRRVEAK